MPFGSVRLRPGVVVDWTPTLNEAGISESQLIRFKDGMAQKYGGWSLFYPFALNGVPREIHPWQDLNQVDHVAIGTTSMFGVITTGNLQDLTPQTLLSNFAPNFSTVNLSPLVNIVDPNINTVTTFDAVFFNTPVSVGGIILSGFYPIDLVTGANSYRIRAATNATATVSNGGAVPVFTTTNLSAIVAVGLNDNAMAVGDIIAFAIPTTGNGVTISGGYAATTITNPNSFQIQVSAQASASGSFSMNGGNAQIVYYIALGPTPGGAGYGLGGYGLGGYGTGIVPSAQTGTPISATDWTADNWGQIALACPEDGAIYYWDPTGGFTNMAAITSAPIFNAGMFVSTTAQIVVAYGTSIEQKIGVQQDPMLVGWSDSGDFFNWTPGGDSLAGNYRIPIGSRIMGGEAVQNQNLIWTDLDLWAMNFIGYPNTYGFNKIGSGAGLISSHAKQQLRGGVHWMGFSNFYSYAADGVKVVPCPVWDVVFQNINMAFAHNVRAMPNTPFNEAGYLYPSLDSVDGENDSYVKYNITEPNQPWDYGLLKRSAWCDLTVVGSPLSALPTGFIYRQETTPDAAGQPLVSSFTTGYFMIAEGEDFVYVDQVYPDFKWGTYGGVPDAQIMLTFNVVNYPGDAPTVYGPYPVMQSTKFLSTRMRGRQMSITVTSSGLGSFWRVGRIRYRFSSVGRR